MLRDPKRRIHLLTYKKDLCSTYLQPINLQPINLNLKPCKHIYLFKYKVVLVINSLTLKHVIGTSIQCQKWEMNLVKKLNFNCCSFKYSYSTNLNKEQYSYLNILHYIFFQMYI